MASLEGNKLIAAVLVGGIAVVGSGVMSGILYHPHVPHDMVYTVAPPEGVEVADAEPAGPEPILDLLASADPAAGEGIFRSCSACHNIVEGGANKVGPNLYNVVGRDIGGYPGFAYSNALAEEKDGPWDYEALNGFLWKPKEWAPGTKMSYAGLSKPEDRANIIAYLASKTENPPPIPDPAEVDATEETPVEAETEEQAALSEDAPAEQEQATAAAAEQEVATVEPVEEAQSEAAAPAEQAQSAQDSAQTDQAPAAAEQEQEAAAAAQEAAPVEEQPQAEAAAPAEEQQVAAVDTEMADQAAAADIAPEADGIVSLIASADPADGERVFRQCAACHNIADGAANKVGPNLYGVVGRNIASYDGFRYSDALSGKDGAWDHSALNAYLENPREWAPGTKMSYRGLREEQDRASVIAYLRANTDNPPPLTE